MKRLSARKQRLARLFDVLMRPVWWLTRSLIVPRAGDVAEIRSILVVELWRLGDLALLTPALVGLRRRFPQARIALLAPPAAEELLRESQLVDEVIPVVLPWTAGEKKYDLRRYEWRALRQLIHELRSRHFDLALSARMDLRDHLLMALSGARRRVGFDYGGGAFFLTDALTPADGHHAADWAMLAEHVGAPSPDRRLSLSVSAEERAWARGWLSERGVEAGNVLIGIHPGANAPARQWAPDRFASVAATAMESGARALVFEPGDATTWPEGALTAAGPSLRQFLALLSCCDVLVCNDSGPMHLAAALGVKTVSVFTAQRPEWYAPEGEGHAIAVVEGFACRPCWDSCIFAEPYCNTSLGVEQVAPLVEAAVARATAAKLTVRGGR